MDRLGTVPDWLRQRADVTPERLAVIFEDERWSFVELDRRVDSAVEALRGQGVAAGQRAGVLATNGLGFVVAVHALMRIGAVLVPINTRLTPIEIDWQVRDAELNLLLRDDDVKQLVERRDGPKTRRERRDGPKTRRERRDGPKTRREFDLGDWHSIIYTSGTTGRPKGAVLTYANHWWSAIASTLNLGLLPDDRWLVCLPLFHVGGLSILLRSVVCGMTAVVHSRFDPGEVNLAIDEQGVTMVSVVSAMLERMLSERAGRAYPPTLRCVLLGGGPAPLPLLERALQAGVPVVQTYGLTETASQVVTLAPEDAVRKLGSAGKPLMSSQIMIEPDGEICVLGPTVSPGYLHQPARDGWLHTGDLGFLDDEGYLYVLDRRDDLIISGGENVYPAEVEAALVAHPAVTEAGVIGLPDAGWGRAVAALVVLEPGREVTAEELVAFCRQRLAGYKVPRRIVFCESLPRNAAGKLLRRELRIEG